MRFIPALTRLRQGILRCCTVQCREFSFLDCLLYTRKYYASKKRTTPPNWAALPYFQQSCGRQGDFWFKRRLRTFSFSNVRGKHREPCSQYASRGYIGNCAET